MQYGVNRLLKIEVKTLRLTELKFALNPSNIQSNSYFCAIYKKV